MNVDGLAILVECTEGEPTSLFIYFPLLTGEWLEDLPLLMNL